MNDSARHPFAPPRLLLGVTLLFWGAVTEHPLVGLLCALLIEARSWIDLRWNFGERGFVRAWSLSVMLGFLTLAGFWLQGESFFRLFNLLVWIPVFLLPVMLAQQYSLAQRMPLNTFSFIARRKMEMDRREGRPVHPIEIHFGYIYFCLVLVSAALSDSARLAFFIGLLLLAVLALFFVSPTARRNPVAWSLALLFVVTGSTIASLGLWTLYRTLSGLELGSGTQTPTERIRTGIGKVGELKLTYKIFWRVQGRDADGPRLFRQAVYNRYNEGFWTHKPMRGRRPREDYDDMVSLPSATTGEQFAFERDEFEVDLGQRKHLTLRGAVQTLSALPLPDDLQRLDRVLALQGGLEYNSIGTVRLENPDHPVVDLDIYYDGPGLYERDAEGAWDLQIPDGEQEGLSRVARDWGLLGRDARDAQQIIRERFVREFTYSMYNPGRGLEAGSPYREAVSVFLEGTRRGHCEYFATAAVLLLREAGIPARYCVGFSAQEQDQDTGDWILRGRHGHAWCRVYVGGTRRMEERIDSDGSARQVAVWEGGRWVDFDPTPPGWFQIEGSVIPWERRVVDWWQRTREDFLVWRTSAGNRTMINAVMGLLVALLLGFVAWRLVRSHTRRERGRAGPGRALSRSPIVTPLHELAGSAEHWLGPRPPALAFSNWIRALGRSVPAIESSLRRAIDFHWKARFDPIGLEAHEEDEFQSLCRDLKHRLKEQRRAEG